MYNDIIILGEDKSKHKDKGGGINAIVTLLKEIESFQESVTACKEAQAIQANKDAIAEFETYLDKIFNELLEMAKAGWQAKRKQNAMPEVDTPPVEEPVLTPVPEAKSTTVKKPVVPSM